MVCTPGVVHPKTMVTVDAKLQNTSLVGHNFMKRYLLPCNPSEHMIYMEKISKGIILLLYRGNWRKTGSKLLFGDDNSS